MRDVNGVGCDSFVAGWIDVRRRGGFGASSELIVVGESRDSFAAFPQLG